MAICLRNGRMRPAGVAERRGRICSPKCGGMLKGARDEQGAPAMRTTLFASLYIFSGSSRATAYRADQHGSLPFAGPLSVVRAFFSSACVDGVHPSFLVPLLCFILWSLSLSLSLPLPLHMLALGGGVGDLVGVRAPCACVVVVQFFRRRSVPLPRSSLFFFSFICFCTVPLFG